MGTAVPPVPLVQRLWGAGPASAPSAGISTAGVNCRPEPVLGLVPRSRHDDRSGRPPERRLNLSAVCCHVADWHETGRLLITCVRAEGRHSAGGQNERNESGFSRV